MAEGEERGVEPAPRLSYLKAFLGPNGWHEPMVWVLAGGWLIYLVWALVIVMRGSEIPNFLGLGPMYIATWMYQLLVPDEELKRQVDRYNLARRSASRTRRSVRVLVGLALAISWGAGVLVGWDIQVVRLAVVVLPGALWGWRLHSAVQERRDGVFPPVPRPAPIPRPARSGFVDLMRHDR